jgi:spore coat protein CotH
LNHPLALNIFMPRDSDVNTISLIDWTMNASWSAAIGAQAGLTDKLIAALLLNPTLTELLRV